MLTEKLNELIAMGADIAHINGSLIDHLKGTYFLLELWDAEKDLCTAGLYHALYGTSGFENHLIPHHQRNKVKEIIGEASEHIVYLYCACERNFFWPQIGINPNPIFLDRFTNTHHQLSLSEMAWFCELTVANEMEIAKDNADFIKKYGSSLSDLFHRMKPYISVLAMQHVQEILM